MRRILWLTAALIGASALNAPGQGAGRTPAEKLEAIKKEYADALGAYKKKAARLEDEDQRDELYRLEHPRSAAYFPRLLALAEKWPKDPAAFEALAWALTADRGPVTDSGEEDARRKLLEKAESLLLRDHAGHAGLPQVFGSAGDGFLRAVWAKSPVRAVRGEAGLTLAGRRMLEVRRVSRWRAHNPGWEWVRIAVEWGLPWFATWEPFVTPDLAALSREAEVLFERLAKDYADVPVERRAGKTVGEVARAYLHEMRHLTVGKPLPELKSVDLAGKPVSTADLKGRVVVIDVWATWCGACHAMLPGQRALVKRLEGKPFTLVSVSADEKAEQVTKFLKTKPMPWTHWFDGPAGPVQRALNVNAYPTIYVIDAKGMIRHKDVRGKSLDDTVEALVKEAEGTKGDKR